MFTPLQVKQVAQAAQCGMLVAKKALSMRQGNVELAIEYANRYNLAAVMSGPVRFPKWYAYLNAHCAELLKQQRAG